MSPISTSGMMRTLAFHHSAQGKADRMSALSVKSAARGCPCPLAGRSRWPSGPPFTARPRRFAIQASLASVARSRARAAPRSSVVFPQLTPDPLQLTTLLTGDRMLALSMKPERASSTASRRQDVANKHQRNDENLGFSSFRPRKGRQDVGAFREVKPGPDAARYCVCCGSRSRCPR